jgi:hypothetical protein
MYIFTSSNYNGVLLVKSVDTMSLMKYHLVTTVNKISTCIIISNFVIHDQYQCSQKVQKLGSNTFLI